MNESEIIRLIKRTVRSELAQTLGGYITDTDDAYLCSLKRFDADAEVDDIRIIRPYGFASRAPEKTPTVVHPINGDPSHLLSLGDFDTGNRPSIEDSESALYGSSGQVAYTSGSDFFIGDYVPATGTFLPTHRAAFHENGSFELGILKPISANAAGEVFLGGTSASSPAVLGDILSSMLGSIISQLTTALNAIGAGPIVLVTGAPGSPSPTSPTVTAALTAVVTQLAAIQVQYLTNPLTNIESSIVFVERI